MMSECVCVTSECVYIMYACVCRMCVDQFKLVSQRNLQKDCKYA